MDFISLKTLCFLILTIGINALLPQNKRHYWLLLSSLFFISFLSWQSAIVMVILGTINFFISNALKENRLFFYAGFFLNILAIIGFNYLSYYNHSLSVSFQSKHFSLNEFILALGLSFYSIQHLVYLVEVGKGKINPEKNYLNFLFCTSFFPKLISGPITKYAEIRTFVGLNKLSKEIFFSGFNRFLLGVFKKLVIADSLAPSIHSVFDFPNEYSGFTILTGGLLFTIQLYFDFSGYTDMAIGVAKMLGVDLPENFNMPLRSLSIGEFWRKWHISLIRFFTEYIFYPIAYKYRKYNKTAAIIGITATFLISGLWHGIGLTFVLWAVCHLIYLILELFLFKRKGTVSLFRKALAWFYVIVAVSFSNVFFRIKSIDLLVVKCKNLFSLHNFFPADFESGYFAPIAVGWHQIEQFNFFVTILICTVFLIFERKINALSNKTDYSILYTYILIILILLFGTFNSGEQFIYMQF